MADDLLGDGAETDVFPALALGVGEGGQGTLSRPPRDPAEPILTRRHWLSIAGFGVAITVAVLAGLAIARGPLGLDLPRAVTVSFLVLAFAQLWHVFDMAGIRSGILRNEVTRNPWVWVAVVICVALLLAAVYVPPLAAVLETAPPGAEAWAVVLPLSLAPTLLATALRIRARRFCGRGASD